MKLKFLLVLILIFNITFSASAHFTEENESKNVTVHISPNDEPIAGQNSTIEFMIESDNDDFNFENCNCELNIKLANEIIETIRLVSSQTNYIFPEEGLYQIEFIAKPTNTNTFTQFKAEFEYSVKPAEIIATESSTLLPDHAAETSMRNSNFNIAYFPAILGGIIVIILVYKTKKI